MFEPYNGYYKQNLSIFIKTMEAIFVFSFINFRKIRTMNSWKAKWATASKLNSYKLDVKIFIIITLSLIIFYH